MINNNVTITLLINNNLYDHQDKLRIKQNLQRAITVGL